MFAFGIQKPSFTNSHIRFLAAYCNGRYNLYVKKAITWSVGRCKMDAVYLLSLLVGGFFVLLSIFGGEMEADTDVDVDLDADFDMDADFDLDADIDLDAEADIGAGAGFVDLFSVRALFLFATFFGLAGKTFTWFGTDPVITGFLAVLTGLIVGLGGNFIIKRFAYRHVSSDVSTQELKGRTGKVLLPFSAGEKGKISLVVKGNQLRLIAKPLDDASSEAFEQGEEVVVVRTEKGIAEVVKPT